jgi:ATP-dependent protease HslVU (ClpYQ) peptidase subunit
MTVIAWDGKILAADKLMTMGAQKVTVKKIFKHETSTTTVLLGYAGCIAMGESLIDWFINGQIEKYPQQGQENGADLLVIEKNKKTNKITIYLYSFETPNSITIEEDKFAIGSGFEGAMVAMTIGARADRAVELTSRFNKHCGHGVDTLTF